MPKEHTTPRVNLCIYALNIDVSFQSQAKRSVVLDVLATEHIDELTIDVPDTTNSLPFEATLFVRRRDGKRPPWTDFLSEGFENVKEKIAKNSPNSAVLLVNVSNRYYAVPFGYGARMIRATAIVRGFGLRTTLGLIDPSKVSAVDAKTVDLTTLFTKIQSNRTVAIHEFSMDLERDMIRGAYGFPENETELCSKAIGSDALYINPRTTFKSIGSILNQCWTIYEEKTYKNNFGFVDLIRPVADPSLIAELDSKLIEKVRQRDQEVGMGLPTPTDEQNTLGFRFSRGTPHDQVFDDINLETYASRFRDFSQVSLKQLKDDRISRISNDDQDAELDKWSPYRWLIFETAVNGKNYVLQDGDYYEVETAFRKRLNNDVNQIERAEINFPDWDKKVQKNELEYNTKLREAITPSVLLDQKCATDFEGRSRLEVCDVLGLNNNHLTFIHVKKYDGSGVLSHLFSQGAVSAQAMLEDARFRTEVRSKLPKEHQVRVPKDSLSPSNIVVLFAMAFKQPGQKNAASLLPFFSRLNLRQRVHSLSRMGVKCLIGIIKFIPDDTA